MGDLHIIKKDCDPYLLVHFYLNYAVIFMIMRKLVYYYILKLNSHFLSCTIQKLRYTAKGYSSPDRNSTNQLELLSFR